MPKLCLCWHKPVWSLLTSAISCVLGVGGMFWWLVVSSTCTQLQEAGQGIRRHKVEVWQWPPVVQRWKLCALHSGTTPCSVACILNLFPNRSGPQWVHVTLITQIHYDLSTYISFQIILLFSFHLDWFDFLTRTYRRKIHHLQNI